FCAVELSWLARMEDVSDQREYATAERGSPAQLQDMALRHRRPPFEVRCVSLSGLEHGLRRRGQIVTDAIEHVIRCHDRRGHHENIAANRLVRLGTAGCEEEAIDVRIRQLAKPL